MAPAPIWRVRFDLDAWEADLTAASGTARGYAERWRLRIEIGDGLPHRELRRTRADDDIVPLPQCVKTRIPDPDNNDPQRSPWGAVLEFASDPKGPYLSFLAFGLRHPPSDSRQASVYARAHRRLGRRASGR